jgi:DNA polymerase-3 subunit delta'
MPREDQDADAAPLPRANALLLGHEEAERWVARWIAEDRLPHALLICGPWGVGKATLAFRVARWLLRRTAPDDDLGGVGLLQGEHAPGEQNDRMDKTFRWVASGTHPDLLAIERRFDERRGRPHVEIVVEDVRRVGSFLASSPALGGWRVVIIDSADQMNRHAANALLKVLEEPSGKCLLILVVHRPALVPDTIRSRCRQMPLRPLNNYVLDALMARYLPGPRSADADILRELGEGSIGRIMQLARHDAPAIYRMVRDVFQALATEDDRMVAILAASAAGSNEEEFRVTSHVLSWWLRRIGRACLSAAPISITDEEKAIIDRLAAPGTLDQWLSVWDKTQRLATQAEFGNLDRKQALSAILLDMRHRLQPSAL